MEDELGVDALVHTDHGMENYDRDIPGETGLEQNAVPGSLSGLAQFPSSLMQNSAASPILRGSRENSRSDIDGNNLEPLLFTPIKMLDFEEVDGAENKSRLPAASLSKSSTPNPKSATKSGIIVSPDRPLVLSVDEMEASPILPEQYMESTMERELECRLINAGRMGEESPSDRGSRERSPVIDGAEHEDTIQNRFQMMAGRTSRQDPRGKGFQKKAPSSSQKDMGPPQMYPVRMGPNHINDGLANYNISRPSHVQGMAQGDSDNFNNAASMKPNQGQFMPYFYARPSTQGLFSGNKVHQPIGSRGTGLEGGSGMLGWASEKGGNFQQLRAGNPLSQLSNPASLAYGNQNQSAAADKDVIPSQSSMASRGYELQETGMSKFSGLIADESTQSCFMPPVYQNFTSVPQPSPPLLTGELPTLNQSEAKDMDDVFGHLKKVIQQGQALVGNVEDDNIDGVSDLITGQGHGQGHGQPSQGHRAADMNFSPKSQGSAVWFEARGHTEPANALSLDDASRRIWGDNSGRYQSDPTLVAENRVLKETVEKERYRRKHCENHIHQLNSKLLEAQQQLAVVVAQSNKKDAMVEQLDKQFAQVVDGWRKKEADSEELIKKLRMEKGQMEASVQQQAAALKKFESDLASVVDELREERQTASLSVDKLNTQLEEQSRELSSLFDELTSERERAQLMTAEWEKAKEGRDLAEVKVENLQEQLHKEQDNWYRRERELLQKLDELTDSKLKAIQEERKRTEEKGSLVVEVEDQLRLIMVEMEKSEKELDAAVREKESLKVEMSLKEAKHENSLKKLEADLKMEYQTQMSEKLAELKTEQEELDKRLAATHRQHIEELTNQHQAEVLRQARHYEDIMKQKAEQEYQEFSKKLTALESENTALKTKKHKLEIQRTEVLSKLQLLMQSQWSEALSILGTSSPSRAHQTTNGSSHRPVLSSTSLLSGLNLSTTSQPLTSAPSAATENGVVTPTRENILALINNFSAQQQQQPHLSHSPWDDSSWQHSQQNHTTNNLIGPSSLPANMTDLLNFTSQSGSSKHSYDKDSSSSGGQSQYNQGSTGQTVKPSTVRLANNHVYQPSFESGQQRSTPKHLHGDKLTNENGLPGFSAASFMKSTMEPEMLKIGSDRSGNFGSREFSQHDASDRLHSNRLQSASRTPPDNRYPGNSRVSHELQFHGSSLTSHDNRLLSSKSASQDSHIHGNHVVSHDNRFHGSNDTCPPDISLISSIHDTTLNSHHNPSFLRGTDQSNQAVPIRPPQQRSRTLNPVRGRVDRHVTGPQNAHPQREEGVASPSPPGSDDITHRLRDYSDGNASGSETQSEIGLESGPRRLEFSPPTKQPRPPGVRTSSEWSGSEGRENSVLDETLRLNEEYSQISDKLEKHESRQSELQHYIQMLLERSPGSPTSPVQDDHPSIEAPNNSLATIVQSKIRKSQSENPKHSRGGRQSVSRNQAVLKSPRQPGQGQGSKQGGLDADQLAEISQLLRVYGSEGRGSPTTPGAGHLLEILQGLNLRQTNQISPLTDAKGGNPAGLSANRMTRPAAGRSADKNKKFTPAKLSNLNGATREIGRSSSVDRGMSVKQAQGKKTEKKISTQSRNSVPKWK